MLRRALAGRKNPVIMWSTKALIWRCSQEWKRRGGICRQIFDKNCWLYPGEARRRVPRFLQVFFKLGARSTAPISIIWHLFGSAECPGHSPRDVQGCSALTLLGLCWRPHQPRASLYCCLTQMCFVWKWGQMAWIHLFLLHKHKTKTKTGGARRGCTLHPDPNILTNTAQSHRMLPDGDYGNFKEKNTNTILQGGGCTLKFAFGRATDLICLKYTT